MGQEGERELEGTDGQDDADGETDAENEKFSYGKEDSSKSIHLRLLLQTLFFFFFKNGPTPASIYFRLFKHTLQFLQQINVKKCPSSILCRDFEGSRKRQ